MTILMIDEDELRARITEHVAAHPGLPDVAQFWHGYLTGLCEVGVIDTHALTRLVGLLPPHDAEAVEEAMLGEEYFAEHPTRKAERDGA